MTTPAPVYDLVVVGAGPAGSAAAVTAVRAGARVLLVDKARFPRDKCCGDGLTTAALRMLEALGLDAPSIPSFAVTETLVLHADRGRIARIPLGGTRGIAAACCRRTELDAALVALAARHGVEVREGDAFESLTERPDKVVVELASGGRFEAEAVVATDGAWSAVRRAVEEAPPRREPTRWHAWRAYVADVSRAAATELLVSFEDGLFPGYVWSFPLADAHANVGVCLERQPSNAGAALARRWEMTIADTFLGSFLGERARLTGPARSWPIPAPLGSLPLSACSGKVLFAGDAARAADAFTGEGIAQALETGVAAAEAVCRAPDAERRSAAYEHALATSVAPDARLSQWCNALMNHPIASRTAVGLAAAGPRIARQVGRFLYEDYPRSAAFSPSRWPRVLSPRRLPF